MINPPISPSPGSSPTRASTRRPSGELQLAISRVLVNAPTGLTTAQKQLALMFVLEEVIKAHPADHQTQNSLAVITTILLGSRLLTAVSATVRADQVQ